MADILVWCLGWMSLQAVVAAGLVNTLETQSPLTVFAPTNDAFAALPAGVLANLLKPENKALLDSVLTYHVVSGEVYSYQIDNGASVPSLDNGAKLAFQVNNGQIYVEETATVINANLQTSNGVVHVISAVLIPPSVQLLLSSM